MSPLATFVNGRPYTTLRGAAFLFLSDVGHIVSGSVAGDSGGGGTTVWTAGTTNIPCRIDALSGSESVIAARISEHSTHEITLPPETAVTVQDRFAIDGRGTFDVTAVLERTVEWTRIIEVSQL